MSNFGGRERESRERESGTVTFHTRMLDSNPKTTRVTAIRIFITPRKEQKVLKPLSSFIFIKNVCDRVREGEGEANGTKSIRIQFSTFPIPSPY